MINPTEVKNILIIGVAGGLAQITKNLLLDKYEHVRIIGIDSRDLSHVKKHDRLVLKKIKYSRGDFEKIFRDYEIDLVYHLGRISHASSMTNADLAKRLDLSVMGTNKILELCLKNEVKKIIILSTFHVYGALSDNPVFLTEDSALRAAIRYPDLRDVVEMDQIATSWMWRYQNEMKTVILRPCNIIGAQINNAISQYLVNKYAPRPMDFNPMFQFIHEFDMANVLAHAIEKIPMGVYNVGPDEYISLDKAMEVTGAKGFPVFMSGLKILVHLLKKNFHTLPDYLVEYLIYPCLIDCKKLNKVLGEDFYRFTTKDALELLKLKDYQ